MSEIAGEATSILYDAFRSVYIGAVAGMAFVGICLLTGAVLYQWGVVRSIQSKDECLSEERAQAKKFLFYLLFILLAPLAIGIAGNTENIWIAVGAAYGTVALICTVTLTWPQFILEKIL